MTQPSDTTADHAVKTTLSKRWLRKFIIFLVVSIGFGIYGYVDATIVYPNRGERDASYRLMEYLRAADTAHGLALSLGVPAEQTPQEYLEDLKSRQSEIVQRASGEGGTARDAAAEIAKMTWFDALAKVRLLTRERIDEDLGDSPRETLAELEAEWSTRDQPKPLSWYDIPVQWLFTFVGFGLGIWIAIHMVRVARKSYTWEPESMRLGLPGGHSIVPSDVADFDKRKWDKFLFFFKIKPEHPQLGGREIKLDLYQYTPLEDWCVAMHKSERPQDYEDDEQGEEAESGGEPQAEAADSEQAGSDDKAGNQ